MTDQDSRTTHPPVERQRFELPPVKPTIVLPVVAFAIEAIVAAIIFVIKVSAPQIVGQIDGPLIYGGDTPMVLGGIAFLAILPIFLGILLGHLALRRDGEVPRGGRAIAGAALGLGYLGGLFWLSRVILALAWPQASGNEYGGLLYSVLVWT